MPANPRRFRLEAYDKLGSFSLAYFADKASAIAAAKAFQKHFPLIVHDRVEHEIVFWRTKQKICIGS